MSEQNAKTSHDMDDGTTDGRMGNAKTTTELNSTIGDLGTAKFEKAEFHLSQDVVEVATPRSAKSGASSSEVFSSPMARPQSLRQRPKSARTAVTPRHVPKTSTSPSNIPLPVKSSGPIKVPPLLKNSRSNSRTSSLGTRTAIVANKHTLEIQFINKNKRYMQLRKELVEKQRPVLEMYQNLMKIKKRLEELGKSVKLDDIKLIPVDDLNKKPQEQTALLAMGEQIPMDVLNEMRRSIEEIPKTLMGICKNLLSRRALIVELLEAVTRSEIDGDQVCQKIDSLKCEGLQLQDSLEGVIQEHQSKIETLIDNWQKLLIEKESHAAGSRITDLENKLKEEEKLREETAATIRELHRKLDEKKSVYDKSVAELNALVQTLKEQQKKLEQDLEAEKKASSEIKSRNNTNAQTIKSMRSKLAELENDKSELESANGELQKKLRLLQEQIKHKEAQWTKEKDELNRGLKHQENLLQKITADKNQFETRLETVESAKQTKEETLQSSISSLIEQLNRTQTQLDQATNERDEAVRKCSNFEKMIARMGIECKETMNRVSYSIEWGKAQPNAASPEAEHYIQEISKDLRICELEDKIREMEKERQYSFGQALQANSNAVPPIPRLLEFELKTQKECVKNYKLLLENSQKQLTEKLHYLRTTEVETLKAEVKQLRVRQETIEEQNERFSAEEMQRLLNDGREKLNDLTKKYVQKEEKLDHYETVIEKQRVQMTEMDKLLRYRENMVNVLKVSRNDLLQEKDSLAKYSKELRGALNELSEQSTTKEALVSTLQEKIALRETHLRNMETKLHSMDEKLKITNEKRYKLQETISALERELQIYRNAPPESYQKRRFFTSVNGVGDKPTSTNNKSVSQYCESLLDDDNDDRATTSTTFRRFGGAPSESNSSDHAQCFHTANSRSLISLSLQTVDFIKSKLNYLSSVGTALPESEYEETTQRNKDELLRSSNRNLDRMVDLTAKGYGYLRKRSGNDAYHNSVKFAVTKESRRKI